MNPAIMNRLPAHADKADRYWVEHRKAMGGFHALRGNEHERAFVSMLSGWLRMADAAQDRFESPIGDDYVLGPHWEAIGRGLLELLNGETGRIDAGTVDGIIRDTLEAHGFSRGDS